MRTLPRLAALASLLALPGALAGQAAPVPYDNYPAPSACVSVGQRAMAAAIWDQITDTLPIDPDRRVVAEAQAEIRRCLQQVLPGGMNVRGVPERDVAALFFLGRGLALDSIATPAWHRALGQQRIRDDSTTILWHLSGSYANGSPTNLATTRRIGAWLDTLGVIGERPLLPNDSFWISQHGDANELARALFDTAAMRAEIAGIRKNAAALPPAGKKGSELTVIGAQAEELLLALLQNPQSDSAVAALKAKALEQLGPQQEEEGYGGAMLMLGEHYGPLHPDFWFGRNPSDSIFPRPGRITLVQVVVPRFCTCEEMAATLHRLKARFGDSLDILLVLQTAGHFNGRVKLTPAEEAAAFDQRIHQEWKVDGVVGVYTTTFVPNADPDRRLVAQVIPELRHIRFGNDAMIIDRRGKMILAGAISASPWQERTLIKLVESLLKAPAN